jgi:hypothetical protein
MPLRGPAKGWKLGSVPLLKRGAVKRSPPILGGVEAHKSFGGGKGRPQTQDGQASSRSTTH